MRDEPSYLGLLNAIAVGERRGHAVLDAWRRTTPDSDLAAVLNVVALRERANAAAFAKRLSELGYQVRETANQEYDDTLAVAGSTAGDAEKFRRVLGYGDARNEDDALKRLFDDATIDPETGALLGRFIAEERASERLLRAAWARCRPASGALAPEERLLEDIAERIERLSRTLDELKTLGR